MPTLSWIGKEAVLNHHLDVPFRTLERKYTYGDYASDNMIVHGDNLEALKSLLPRYEGRVKCIYIDPPYNTGNEGWAYNDNVRSPKIVKWLGQVVGKEAEDLTRHDKWLCMMYPRLKLLQRLLADNGAIFISIDDNEQANLKLICDEIFGAGNFVTDLIWRSSDSSNHDAKQFSVDYNHTLVYSKSTNWLPARIERKAENNLHYKNPDNDPRGPWFASNVSSPNPRANLMYDVISPQGIAIHAPKNGWRWSEEKMAEMIKEGTVVFLDEGKRLLKKTYLKDQTGLVPSNIWWDIEETGHNRNAKYELKKIFPELKTADVFKTPKPTKFIDKILQLFNDKDCIVLDSFAGSGTTAHAVLNLNKADGGNRKFILIEMEDYADTTTAERVRRVISGYGEGNKAVAGTGGDFSFYELGEPVFENGNLNPRLSEEEIRKYVWYSETHSQYTAAECDNKYFLGSNDEADYYFYFEPDHATTLDMDFLATIKKLAEQYIIYADNCALPQELLQKYHIVFKKIPRDIKQF